jgi:hypothetical protein
VIPVLRIVRRLRRLARRIFGSPTPHYVKGIYGLFKWINFLELLPTLLAVTAAPKHFFRRLTPVLRSPRTLYQKPIPFLRNSILFSTGLLFLIYPKLLELTKRHFLISQYLRYSNVQTMVGMGQKGAYLCLAAFAALSPLWIMLLCLLLFGVYRFVRNIPVGDMYDVNDPPRPRSLHQRLLLPVSADVYRRLRWDKYFWGLFYFGITAFLMLQVVGACWIASLGLLRAVLIWWSRYLIYFPAFLLLPFLMIPAAVTSALVTQPYIELLTYSCRIPVTRLYKDQVEAASVSFGLLLIKVRAVNTHKFYWQEQATKGRYQEGYDEVVKTIMNRISDEALRLIDECQQLSRALRMQNIDATKEAEQWKNLMEEERNHVFSTALSLDELEALLDQTSLNTRETELTAEVVRSTRKVLAACRRASNQICSKPDLRAEAPSI